MSHIDIYCDGSIQGKPPKSEKIKKPMWIGYAFSVVDQIGRTVLGVGAQRIKQREESSLAEMLAFDKAVTYALFVSSQVESIHIHTDCLNIINVLNVILQRKAYGARNPYAGYSDVEVWKRIVNKWQLMGCRIAVMYIKSHMSGTSLHIYHDEVDKVARRAARQQKFVHIYKDITPTMLKC